MDRVKRIWYLLPMRAAKVQASLRIRAVSPEPPLLAHTSSESRGTFRQKARSLAPLNGWTCAVKVCHDGMLEDTNCRGSYYTPPLIEPCHENIRIFNGREVWIENSVKRVKPRDAEQLFRVNNHYYRFFFLHTLLSTIAFRLEYVLFYQFYAKTTTFFDQEMFGLALLLYVWPNLTSKSSYGRHARESSCTPSCKTTFPSPGCVHGNSGLVCKKTCLSHM